MEHESEWDTAREALSALLYEALSEPEIRTALAGSDITDREAGQAILDDHTVLARIRMEQDEVRWLGLRFDTFDDDRHERPRVTLAEVGRLLFAFALGVGYISLMRAAWAGMALIDHVIVVIGFIATVAISCRVAIERTPGVLALLGVYEREGDSDETYGLGDRWNTVLVTLVQPELLRHIESRRQRIYSTKLRSRQVTNLYIEDDTDVVVTEATERLGRVLKRSASGAIALAGQRGTGKTTAIQSIMHGRFQSPDSPPPLTVVAAAPARYEARDFVLHLHALLCKAVIAKVDEVRAFAKWDGPDRNRDRLRGILGPAVVITAVVYGGSQLLGMTIPAFLTDLQRAAATIWHGFPEKIPDVFLGGSFLRGTVLVACVVAALYGVRLVFALPGSARWLWRRSTRRRRDPLTTLKTQARQQLDRIRFLQTFTSGWSGKISTPLKGEASRTWQSQRAEQQLTHPEVVEEFRRFARTAAATLVAAEVIDRIVIAIDELDKIGQPEKAHEFVNDIKGVFGVPGCLFLVSVSDDAFTTFEQRGIAVRDAFDSAFAEMIRMDHFTVDESRRWISRRLPGAPEQFILLCHCLSGGLPRDLRRCVVDMLDAAFDLYNPPLSAVVARMVRQEVLKKSHAFAGMARSQEAGPGISRLMGDLLAARSATTPGEMLELAKSLAEPDEHYAQLRAQSSGFLLFCATILEVFTDTLDGKALRAITLAPLATVRQQMAVDPQVARGLLVRFRKEHGLQFDDLT
ncbi:hypothetical protein KIPE111705_15995 [Kibdelosporangium persicum]|uniref:KAP NTPase domain-containing protein n=1 Tax=Kibdelosporangium persicum TaxID=2698649 RepID=A0ABX2F258_9PSEU|nr:hypothetical protein [Kibdelosporangium persicum]NRN65075.1 KAP NTPase domain-containing protein [Kibdelosporangium persicum]